MKIFFDSRTSSGPKQSQSFFTAKSLSSKSNNMMRLIVPNRERIMNIGKYEMSESESSRVYLILCLIK